MRVPYQRLLNILILEWEEVKSILIEKILNNDVGFFKELLDGTLYSASVVFPDTSKNLDIRSRYISNNNNYFFLSKDYFVYESICFSLLDKEQIIGTMITHNHKTYSRTNLSDDIDENYEILTENFYNDGDLKEIRGIHNIISDFYLFCWNARKL